MSLEVFLVIAQVILLVVVYGAHALVIAPWIVFLPLIVLAAFVISQHLPRR